MTRTLIAIGLVSILALGSVGRASAQSADQCQTGQSPKYVFGFATLHNRLGDWMGAALTCEFPDPNATGDVHQRTTKGLAFWRKSTNTPTFTNGSEHWALSSRGFLYWQGSSIDPPANAVAAGPNTAAASAPTVTRPSTPPPTTAPPTYATPNGPRTEAQLRNELAAAGYGGPWDVAAMLTEYERATLTAYERATAPTPTPTPTPNPVVAHCQAVAAAYPAFYAAVEDATRASARNDYQALRSIAATLRSRTYPDLLLPVVNAFLRVTDWQAAAAEIRFNWPLLTITASQLPNGQLIIAAAQADLARADGEARVAVLDFEAALRQLLQTCRR